MSTGKRKAEAVYTVNTEKILKAQEDDATAKIDYDWLESFAGKPTFILPFADKFPRCSNDFSDYITVCRDAENVAYNELCDTCDKRRVTLLTGPPGVGKSTVAWRFALLKSKHNCVSWVDLKKSRYFIIEVGNIQSCGQTGVGVIVADIIIFDGATNDNTGRNTVIHHLNNRSYGKSIIVSSVGGSYKNLGCRTFEHIMPAWTMSDYLKAVSHDNFFKQVYQYLLDNERPSDPPVPAAELTLAQRNELVRRKYVFAGHCCRWMFGMPTADVLLSIANQIDRIENYDNFFHMNMGERALAFKNKNSVVTRDPHSDDPLNPKLVFVSDYVARSIAGRMTTAVGQLNALANMLGSQAMKGHALEIDFLYAVRNNLLEGRVKYVIEPIDAPEPAPLLSDEEVDQVLDAIEALEESDYAASDTEAEKEEKQPRALAPEYDQSFNPGGTMPLRFTRDVLNKGVKVDFVVGTYMTPDAPNQGGYDAVQLCRRGGEGGELFLRFVQVTVQHDHPIKLHYMRIFLMDFNRRRRKENLPPVSLSYEVVVLLPMNEAVLATPPWKWKVTGDERTDIRRSGSSSKAPPKKTCTRRVAGYMTQKQGSV